MTESDSAPWVRHLGWDRLIEQFAKRLSTPAGKLRATELLRPAEDPDESTALLAQIVGVRQMLGGLADRRDLPGLRGCLRGLVDVGDLLERVSRGSVLSAAELWAVSSVTEATEVAAAGVTSMPPAEGCSEDEREGQLAIASLLEPLTPCSPLNAALRRSLERDGDDVVLRDDADPKLAAARRGYRSARKGLASRAQKMLRRPEYKDVLRDAFVTDRSGRTVLPARSDAMGKLERGTVVHAASTSGNTLFVEPPELFAENNAVAAALASVHAEERRVLAELSRAVGEVAPQLGVNASCLIVLDAALARSDLSEALGGVAPHVVAPSDGHPFVLPGVRHPLMLLSDKEVIPSDLELVVGRCLLISGPNAGGKTVALKAVGLCVLMARAGLHLPVREPCEVPAFQHIITDIGDDQSIAADLSTFSAHLGHVRRALDTARAHAHDVLVLIDEVAAGTDPEQGAALAEAVLLDLTHSGATVVATTHFERLKLLADDPEMVARPERAAPGPLFRNAAAGFDLDGLRPTFRVVVGLPGASSALPLARRMGLPESVVAAAEADIGEQGQRVAALLESLHNQAAKLQAQQESLDAATSEVQRRQRILDEREERARQGAHSKKEAALRRATRELGALEAEIKARRKELRRANASGLPERKELVEDVSSTLARHTERPPEPMGQAPDELEVGDVVFIPSLDTTATITRIRGKKIAVDLAAGLKTTVDRDAIRPPERTSKPKAKPIKAKPVFDFSAAARSHFGDDPKPVVQNFDNTVDVRGERLDEARDAVDAFLADAVARNVDVAVVVHGHGGGILRKGIRESLRDLAHVERFRPGVATEGGDGVTIVLLR